jgi:hypothetical protein
MSQYLVLPANASPDLYPENKNNNYRIKLPKRVSLQSGSWSIGLRSISYTNNWFNIRNGVITIRKKKADESFEMWNVNVLAGRYLDPWHLLSEIRVTINANADTREKVLIHHDETSNTLYVGFDDETWAVKFSDDIAIIYGLLATKWYTPEAGKGNTVSVRCVPDVFAGNSLMYVYCSLVAPRTVGHSQVPLLMEIPVKTPRREVENVFYEPRSPQLVPVSSADTDEVEIDIRRGDGQPFLFRSGTVSVTVELLEL